METQTQVQPGLSRAPAGNGPRWTGFDTGSKVVFFGNSLGAECQRCGAYNSTSSGHRYCTHITCPIALKEHKRRRRKRTSTLEQVYIPRKRAEIEAAVEATRGLPSPTSAAAGGP